MIVIGADTHKSTHTIAAVEAATGRLLGEKTAAARPAGFGEMLLWARTKDAQRVWALEDCRHVSGGLERFLIARGETVVRVAPKLMARTRSIARQRGKSDSIDAIAIARAAITEGPDRLPAARLDGVELEIRLLVDHRERLVAQRTALINDLRWHLHDLWPELEIPLRSLNSDRWQSKLAGRLARAEQNARVRIARDELRRVRELTRTANQLQGEIATLVAQVAPQLLDEIGCGPLTAAKLVGEIAGIDRFQTDAQLARSCGAAPIPASLGAPRSPSPRSRRQPPAQLRPAPHRHYPRPNLCAGACLP
jgi:transposase